MTNRLSDVIAAIDAANTLDPNSERVGAEELPKELLYGQRMTEELSRYCENPSEHLQIASRAQHIERWKSPRSDYPEGRTGYKKWRSQLSLFHAQRAGEIMEAAGYDEEDIDKVKFLIQKRQLKRNPETQTLEDVICLVFLRHYFEEFAAKHNDEKIIDIVQKTWKKMSDTAHKFALEIEYSENILKILKKSLA